MIEVQQGKLKGQTLQALGFQELQGWSMLGMFKKHKEASEVVTRMYAER